MCIRDRDKKLLFYLMEHRHDGPFEMVELKFRLHAPEVVWRQLLRHRTGNFNLQSFRYTEAQAEEFYIPQAWRLQDAKNKQASAGEAAPEVSASLSAALEKHIADSFALYQAALAQGVAREIARLYLPAFALYSTGVVKFDARNLMHFFSLRLAEDAQHEIRLYARAMWGFFAEAFPWCAEAYQRFK
jgi:thymidylate synthase (FAD)